MPCSRPASSGAGLFLFLFERKAGLHTRGVGMQRDFPHPGGGFIHIVHHVIHNPLLFGRLPLCITRPRRWTCRAKNCIILHTPFFAQSGGGWRGGAGAPAGPCARLRGWPGFPMEGGSVRPKRAPRRLPRRPPGLSPAPTGLPAVPLAAPCSPVPPLRPPPAPCPAPLRCALPRSLRRLPPRRGVKKPSARPAVPKRHNAAR